MSERPEVTAEEREKVLGMIGNFTTWLDDMETQQEALPLHEPPAFTSREVSIKLEPIEREVRRLIKKPKPKPPKKPKAQSNATSTNSTAANKTAEAGVEAEAPPEVETAAAPESEADEGEDDTPKHDEL